MITPSIWHAVNRRMRSRPHKSLRKNRFKLFATTAVVTLFVTSCTASSQKPADLPPSGPELRILTLGDSITAAAQVPGGYRTQLNLGLQNDGHRPVFVGSQTDENAEDDVKPHEGHPGNWIGNLDEKHAELLKDQPEIVVLMAGTNDILNNAGAMAPAQMRELIKSIATASPNSEIIVSSIPPLRDFEQDVQAFNAELPDVVAEAANNGLRVYFVDAGRNFALTDLGSDGVHPDSQRAYTKFGDALVKPVGEVFERAKS